MTDLDSPAVGPFLAQVDSMIVRKNWSLDASGTHRDALGSALYVLDRLNHPVPDHLLNAFAGAMDEMAHQEILGRHDVDLESAATAIRLLDPAIEKSDQLEQDEVLDLVHRTLAVIVVTTRRIALEQRKISEPTAGDPSRVIATASARSLERVEELLSRNDLAVSSHSPHRAVLAHALDALDALKAPVPDEFFDAVSGAARKVADAEQLGVPAGGAAAERSVLLGLRVAAESEGEGGLDETRGLELSQMMLAVAIFVLRRMAQESHAVI